MKNCYILFFLLVLTPFLFSRQIYVPEDISTIQNAINDAVNGDSVIVATGIYQENLNFKGKNITVASQFLMTGDPNDIVQTVIDGGQNGSVVIFENHEDNTAILCGFTLTNGSGYTTTLADHPFSGQYGGSVFCRLSNPTLYDLIIRGNKCNDSGGGIFCYLSVPHLKNIVVSQNSSGWNGGGITLDTHSDAIIENVRIVDNEAENWGGGLFINLSNPIFRGTLISKNRAGARGGGIAFCFAYARFDSEWLCSIHSNYSDLGEDLYSERSDIISVHLDTFSVKQPSIVHAFPLSNFLFNVNTGYQKQVSGDIYISETGDDQNNGSHSSPFRTISHALYVLYADSLDTARAFIMDGRYTSETDENFPLVIPDYVSIQGQGRTKTILSGEGSNHILSVFNAQNVRIENLAIKNGAGGISCENSKVRLRNMLIYENKSDNGGAIFAYGSSIWFSNVSIHNNYANSRGGAIYFSGTKLNFDPLNRCSIYLNRAESGGSEFFSYDAPLTHVYLDTFTTFFPTDKEAIPVASYVFDILHAITGVVGSELYVSPQGNDTNSGLSWDDPLKTLTIALEKIAADSGQPGTIYLAEGFYSKNNNGESFPIKLKSYVILKGAGKGKTVLEADRKTSVISSINIQGSTIERFSVTNGRGTYLQYGLDYLYFGGGVYCKDSELVIRDVAINRNHRAFEGGGIWAGNSNLLLENIDIVENSVIWQAGGAYFNECNVQLAGVVVTRNWTPFGSDYGTAGGILFNNTTVEFNSINRSSIFLNNAASSRDISSNQPIQLVLDTFTILNPTSREVGNISNFTFDILHESGYPPPLIYVSTKGNNENWGDIPSKPIQSLTVALVKSNPNEDNVVSIHLDPGIYNEAETGEVFPLGVSDHVRIIGSGTKNTFLDGEGKSTILQLGDANNLLVEGLTLQNSKGALSCKGGSPELKNLRLTSNYENNALIVWDSSPYVQNVLIDNNDGVGIFCRNGNPSLVNVTVIKNNPTGLKTDAYSSSKPIIINSIFWDNVKSQISLESADSRDDRTDVVAIAYSNIQDSSVGIITQNNCRVEWLEGNIYSDPMFKNPQFDDFSLQEESPCIDAGTAYFVWDGKVIIDLKAYDFAGSAPDMGAFEFGKQDIEYNAESVEFFPNFPNPFRSYTNLRFGLPERYLVSLTLYNTLGQKIETIFEDKIFDRGINNVEVDLSRFSSGIYLYVLKIGDSFKAGKIVLIK